MSKAPGFKTAKGRAVKEISKTQSAIAAANRRITEIQQNRRGVSQDPNVNWANDAIQFPRLISELQAVGAFTSQVMIDLRDAMDLNDVEILALVDRADRTWETIKEVVFTR